MEVTNSQQTSVELPAQLHASENPEAEIGDEELDRLMDERICFDPDVEKFLRQLYDQVYVRCVESIRRLYEVDYPTLSEKFFANSPWPSVEDVGAFYREYHRYHHLIMTLYTELYYRHLFMRCPDLVTWEHRKESWNNYALLVEFLADTTCSKDRDGIQLPLQWLWDMLDEFVYQFQDTAMWIQRRCRALSESAGRQQLLQELEADTDVWPAPRVFELLQKIVQQSDIKVVLEQQRQDPAATKNVENELGYQLGYFAMLLQLKLHVQIGAFYAAVRAAEDIEISPKALYWRVPQAHISFMFHLGFAYMMLRRYQDAIRIMSQTLIALSRQRSQMINSANTHNSTMTRFTDRMHVLLLLCASLSGSKLDDSINQSIKEKYSDKYYKLQQDTEESYCELFSWAAPRFIDPSMPPVYSEEALDKFSAGKCEIRVRISKLFLKEVENRRKVSLINSFAKLYHNIPLAKLASLMDVEGADPETQIRGNLMAAKLKGQQRVWKQGGLLAGEMIAANTEGAVDFKIDGDTVHVKNQQTQRVYVDYFVKQIERTEGLISAINQTVIPAPSQADMLMLDVGERRDRRVNQNAY